MAGAGLRGDSSSPDKPIPWLPPSPLMKAASPWCCLQSSRSGAGSGSAPPVPPKQWGLGAVGWGGRDPRHLPSSAPRSRRGDAAGPPASSGEGHGEPGPGQIAPSQGDGVAEPQLGWSQARPRGRSAHPGLPQRTAREGRAPAPHKEPRLGTGSRQPPSRASAALTEPRPWSSTSRPPRRWSRR